MLIPKTAGRYFGYFTAPGQGHPVYDPGPDAPCPICDSVLAGQDVLTISIIYRNQHDLCVFFRTHRACHEALTAAERDALEGNLLDLLVGERAPGGDYDWSTP